jgi:N-hydroxyarylamine O-acetyltransferase
MSSEFRLDRYLERIRFAGTIAPDLPTLKSLHAAHVEVIPFEALDPLLGARSDSTLRLSRESSSTAAAAATVMSKTHCSKRRSGRLASRLWRSARVSDGYTRPKARWDQTHMLLLVDLPQGRFIADVGFGVCVMDAPLEFKELCGKLGDGVRKAA